MDRVAQFRSGGVLRLRTGLAGALLADVVIIAASRRKK
jgi:hypothetical protein